MESLRGLVQSAKGLPRTHESLSDAYLEVFIAFCDDRRAGECRARRELPEHDPTDGTAGRPDPVALPTATSGATGPSRPSPANGQGTPTTEAERNLPDNVVLFTRR